MLTTRWGIGCCCDVPGCTPHGYGGLRDFAFPLFPRAKLRGIGGPAPTLDHNLDEGWLSLAGTGSLTWRQEITPDFDTHGHRVYLLFARVRRAAGSVAGVALLGRYALVCYWDELVWRVHTCDERGEPGPSLAELPIQNLERSWATLYLVRRAGRSVLFRLMASYTAAAPHPWVEHAPADGWPAPNDDEPEVAWWGALGFHGGVWEQVGFTCGRHQNRCHAGEESFADFGHNEWLVHAWHDPQLPLVHDVFVELGSHGEPSPEDHLPIRTIRKMGAALEIDQEPLQCGGSMYTEIHSPEDPAFEPLGEIGVTIELEGMRNTVKGVFFGHDLLAWDVLADRVYWSACDDAGQPVGDLLPVRNTRTLGRTTTVRFTFRRVRQAHGTGYTLLCFWEHSLVFKRTVDGGERALRLGAWWQGDKPVATFIYVKHFPLRWSCGPAVVPYPDCHEELRRNPPIAVRATLNGLEEHPLKGCTNCEVVEPDAILLHSPGWNPALGELLLHCTYGNVTIQRGEPPNTWPERILDHSIRVTCPPNAPWIEDLLAVVRCTDCFVEVYTLPQILLAADHQAEKWDGQSEVTILDADCRDWWPHGYHPCLATSVTLTPIHSPIVVEG